VLAYHIYRSTSDEDARVKVTEVKASGRGRYEVIDRDALPWKEYRYTITALRGDGVELVLGTDKIWLQAPSAFTLEQNHPNPFNPATTIGFTLPRNEHVRLEVYDVDGRLVRRPLVRRKYSGTAGRFGNILLQADCGKE